MIIFGFLNSILTIWWNCSSEPLQSPCIKDTFTDPLPIAVFMLLVIPTNDRRYVNRTICANDMPFLVPVNPIIILVLCG